MKNLLLTVAAVFAVHFLSAQITVTPAGSPSQIATFLTGNGVVMSNVYVYGLPVQYGYFTAANSTLAMNGGLLLTTGQAANVIGPNNSTSVGTALGVQYGDTSLMSIEFMATYDVCFIEMDCVPSDDTLYFNYMFGSEEYDEYVGSAFNDAFGIFIWGSDPAGGNYSNVNMARLPNGTPVAINNVNNGAYNNGPCMNCAYYTHNYTDTTLQYDGTTTNLTAVIPVVPNQTYHIKIILGDAGDCLYDSGVFLQAGSFRCSGQPLDVPATGESPSAVTAFPVPATSSVSFEFSDLNNSGVDITLFSPDGKAVLQQSVAATNNVATLDVSSLAQGIYIAEILHDGVRETKRIVVGE